MPELPDVEVYIEKLRPRVVGQTLVKVRIANPFLLRTVTPPLAECFGKKVVNLRRVGKRIVFVLEGALRMVVHLMVAGRFRWRPAGDKIPGKLGLAAFDFPTGTLLFTEAGSKRRASLHVVSGDAAVAALDPGGIEPLTATVEQLRAVLTRERHTLKRALTDPHLVAGIGGAYSDEIMHRAQLSPIKMSDKITDEEWRRLHAAVSAVLVEWTERLSREVGEGFPEKVTAFRPEMAVHGKYKQPCPVCGSPVQRIVHADNETNYCAKCQTGGKLLADRALSKLLHGDWPRTLEEMEENKAQRRQ